MREPTRSGEGAGIEVRVCALIPSRGGKVLLARHRREGEEYLVFPGGKVKEGEPLAEALKREVKEETGLEVEVCDLLAVGEFLSPSKGRHTLDLLFLALPLREEISPAREGVLMGVEWFPVGALRVKEVRPRQFASLAWRLLVSGSRAKSPWIREPYGEKGAKDEDF